MVDGVVYEFLGLPMGLCCSPRIFTRVTRFASDWLRKRGCIIIIYIDDILVLGKTYLECIKHRNMVLKLLEKLGFIVSHSKSVLEPSTKFTYLGCRWDTDAWTIRLKSKRVTDIKSLASDLLARKEVKVRDIARFLGRTQSAIGVVPLARLRTRTIMYEFSDIAKDVSAYEDYFEMSAQAKEELVLWEMLDENSSLPISPRGAPVAALDTDASDFGYGWYWNNDLFSDTFPLECADLHINEKELWTLMKFLQTKGEKLKDTVLCWRCDNNAALAAIKK